MPGAEGAGITTDTATRGAAEIAAGAAEITAGAAEIAAGVAELIGDEAAGRSVSHAPSPITESPSTAAPATNEARLKVAWGPTTTVGPEDPQC